jgi:DNA (cytosine-5)-methyltransferase 1
MREFVACDFFAGAGGLSEGLHQAGIAVRFANELNKDAALTYNQNHRGTFVAQKNIKNVRSSEVFDVSGSNIFLVAGGPPCQGVSLAGRRDLGDPRNLLFREFVKMVGKLSPKFVMMENVVGLLSMDGGRLIGEIERSLEDLGYRVSKRILNASDFGVPQNRKRVVIFCGNKRKHDINLMPISRTQKITVWDAISDLDFLASGEASTIYLKEPATDYQVWLRGNTKILCNHEASKHGKRALARFSKLKQGQSIKDLPQNLRMKKMVMYRLRPNEPARTITTLPDDLVHYKQDRILTVRETARLQSFPDSYVFFGPRTTGGMRRKSETPQYTQIGNAIPPLMAKSLGIWLKGL